MLDELACLVRDILILKTAGKAGITMLSGVASDGEAMTLAGQLGSGELVRMLNLLQQTMAGFTRSASRRMDAELCILEMCQPELNLDAQALNARLTRLEESLKSGVIAVAPAPAKRQEPVVCYDGDSPPAPGDEDAPPEPGEPVRSMDNEAPPGFWSELVSAARKELRPPASGFFVASPNSPVQGAVVGNKLELRCTNTFAAQTIDKPEILEVLSRKASAQLGRSIRASVVDLSAKPQKNPRMDQLLQFGRAHSDIVKIRE